MGIKKEIQRGALSCGFQGFKENVTEIQGGNQAAVRVS